MSRTAPKTQGSNGERQESLGTDGAIRVNSRAGFEKDSGNNFQNPEISKSSVGITVTEKGKAILEEIIRGEKSGMELAIIEAETESQGVNNPDFVSSNYAEDSNLDMCIDLVSPSPTQAQSENPTLPQTDPINRAQ